MCKILVDFIPAWCGSVFSSVQSMSMIAFDAIMKVYCHLAKSFGVVNLKVIGLRAA